MKRILIFLLVCPVFLFSQSAKDSLTHELSKLAGEKAIIGFAVAIVNQEGVLYEKGFGYSDLKNPIPYSTTSVQPIASISKTLIGVSLLKAQELNLLDLDDDINQYLPFKIVNPRFPESKITIRNIANHSSSLRDTRHYEKSYVFKTKIPKIHKSFPFGLKRLVVKRMVKGYNKNADMPLTEFLENIYLPKGKWYSQKSFGKSPPGEEYAYSNNGAAIASLIIQQVSGMEFTEFVKKYILNPLEMKNSGWDLDEFDKNVKSQLYPFHLEIPEYKLITIADGGFITCIHDFSKYLSAVIRGYNGEDNLITANSYNQMLQQNIYNDNGVFWHVKELDNENFIGHTGGDPGISTIAFFDKRNNLGFICFSNTNTESGEEVYSAIKSLQKFAPRLKQK